MRLFVQLGTQRQDYELDFIEPWFLNRKLSLGVDLYRHQMDFESPNNIYNETRTGARLSLTRALGSDFLIGSVSYAIEDVGISLNSGWHDLEALNSGAYCSLLLPPPNVPERHSGPDRRSSVSSLWRFACLRHEEQQQTAQSRPADGIGSRI